MFHRACAIRRPAGFAALSMALLAAACSGGTGGGGAVGTGSGGSGGTSPVAGGGGSPAPGADAVAPGGGGAPGGQGGGGGSSPGPDASPAAGDTGAPVIDPNAPGPKVDRATPTNYYFTFKANVADPAAKTQLGDEQGFLDTHVTPIGKLVVHLHGSGTKTTCGYTEHGKLLASFGFHVFTPCYDAAVSWSNSACGGNVGNCRLEMLDGTDHSPQLNITRPESIEGRIVAALKYLQTMNPQGDWGYFLDGDQPKWPKIIISGQSFGGSSAPLIAKHRPVDRSVSCSGPFDGGAAWLKETSVTPIDRFYAFSHVADGQHGTHMNSMAAMGMVGMPVEVEKVMPPYNDSHRLVGSLTSYMGAAVDGHNATEARMQSPHDAAGKYLYEPVWRYMYGVPQAP